MGYNCGVACAVSHLDSVQGLGQGADLVNLDQDGVSTVSYTHLIDKGNNLDQNLVKNAADMLRLQLNEKSTPAADKYAFKRFVTMAGSIVERDVYKRQG